MSFLIFFQPFIIMKELMTGLEWLWPRQKFVNRKYRMQEMYENFFVGEEWDLPEDSDPFREDKDTEVLVGCVEVSVACLGYMVRHSYFVHHNSINL